MLLCESVAKHYLSLLLLWKNNCKTLLLENAIVACAGFAAYLCRNLVLFSYTFLAEAGGSMYSFFAPYAVSQGAPQAIIRCMYVL